MKWIMMLVVLGLIPPATNWLRANQRHLPRVITVLGAMQFVTGLFHLVVAPLSWSQWPGFVKGMEVSLIDALSIVLILAAPRRDRIAHLRWPIGIYATIVLVSALYADVWMPAFFYAWQLGRAILLITAVAISCRDPRTPQALILGLVIGLGFEAVMSAKDYVSGALQAGGTFGHQNLLGMVSHFVVFPSIAMLLASRKHKWLWLGPASGMAVAILTASRATIGLAGLGYVLILLISIVRRPTSRKTSIAIAGVVALSIAAPLALEAMNRRFEKAPLDDAYDERAAFERAAALMLHDHPFGVGANQYVVVANSKGYSDRAGVAAVYGSRSAHVHNAYWLSAAETGYIGVTAFITMMLWPVVVALRCAWRFRRDPRGDVLLGLAVCLMIVSLHSLYEWIFVVYNAQYMYALTVGLIAGIAQQMGFWNRRKRATKPRPDAAADGAEAAENSAGIAPQAA